MDLLFCDLKDWNMFFFKYVKDVLYVYGDEVRGLCASLNLIVLRILGMHQFLNIKLELQINKEECSTWHSMLKCF